MDAMAMGRAHLRAAQLWQVPLFAASLGLFGYAAYLFIDPQPGPTIAQRIDSARALMQHEYPEATIDRCNSLLDSAKLAKSDAATVHLLLAEALEAGQKLHHISIEANHQRIIEQTLAALGLGALPTSDIYRRMGESYAALERPQEALADFRKAISLAGGAAAPLLRRVIDLQIAANQTEGVEESLNRYLDEPHLANADRAWALNQEAELLAKRGEVAAARKLLEESLTLDADPVAQGVARYYEGFCAWTLHDSAEAERLLRVARDELTTRHPLDAEAAYLLGRIAQERNNPKEAISFYEHVINDAPASHPAPLARLGRGQCRILLGEEAAGLADLQELARFIAAKPTRNVYKLESLEGLKQISKTLVDGQNYPAALEVLALEQSLAPDLQADYFNRLAAVYERRASQLEKTSTNGKTPEEASSIEQQVRALRIHAGDASEALSRKLTLTDDRASGQALWHGVDLYDRAGANQKTADALERFAADRPEDGQTPEALLRLGRAYQAMGQLDKAISAFMRNQFRYPQSLAASKSGVPLAQAYISQGPEMYGKAEKTLLAVVEDNPVLTPEAEEFRQALFELAQLAYRTGRFEEAIGRIEEMTQRYPDTRQAGQLLFLMADSYRKSAALLSAASAATTRPAGLPTTAPVVDTAEAVLARADRLNRAHDLFDQTIEYYQQAAPKTEADVLYQKLAYFYRADCEYDLGRYEQAIKLYSAATLRYQEDPASLAGYVQIVNAYTALGKADEARAANERAKWLLRKIPPQAFDKQKSALPKENWDDWLNRAADSGLFAMKGK